MAANKTHWLQNPNKNYLGHWDLPDGNDLVLTIKSAGWEAVTNPITNTTESKRVIHWEEDFKPMIVNQSNAQSIVIATGVNYIEKSKGCRIRLFVGKHKDTKTKQIIDCLRVRTSNELNVQQIEEQLQTLFDSKFDLIEEQHKSGIEKVIKEKITLSYRKVYNYLNNLK